MTVVLVILGAAIGAPARYLADVIVTSRVRTPFPVGTFVVNVAGSLLLGLVAAATLHGHAAEWIHTLVATGFCGAFTTFSTFSYETVRLIEAGRIRTAVTTVAGSIVVSFAALSLGWWLGSR